MWLGLSESTQWLWWWWWRWEFFWRWRWLSYKNNDFAAAAAATADDDDDDDDDNDDENNDDDGLAMGVVKGARRPRLNAISACNIPNDASNYDSKLAYNLGLKHSCEPWAVQEGGVKMQHYPTQFT